MKRVTLTIILTLLFLNIFSQTDTVSVKEAKGFLFLSAYNYQYDYDGNHMRPVGFHDFFFLNSFFDDHAVKDSICFNNGVRVDYIAQRHYIKSNAQKIFVHDSSRCYAYDSFYVIPVKINYRIFEDNWPFSCRRNYFTLTGNNGSSYRFNYTHKAILFTRIEILSVKTKKYEKL